MSVETYLRSLSESAREDAEVAHALAERMRHAVHTGDAARACAMARSLASLALALAGRIDHRAAYAAGAEAALTEPMQAARARRHQAAPDAQRPERRRRATGRRGTAPWEYHVGDEWLTAAELAERAGIGYQAMCHRIARGTFRPTR